MKKKTTLVTQPDKTEIGQTEVPANQNLNQKMYRDHKVYDHYSHGRVNKFPFGSSSGPVCF